MWLSIVDTQPAAPIFDDRPLALQERVRFVERLAALRFQKPRHHQRRALASFLAMDQHAPSQREFFIDQRGSLVERSDAFGKERHVHTMRRLALWHGGDDSCY